MEKKKKKKGKKNILLGCMWGKFEKNKTIKQLIFQNKLRENLFSKISSVKTYFPK